MGRPPDVHILTGRAATPHDGAAVFYTAAGYPDVCNCRSEKALNILKLVFQMGYGIKIGKEYFVPKERHDDFIRDFSGKEVFV